MYYEEKYDEVIETAMMLSYGSDITQIKKMMMSVLDTHEIDVEQFFSMYIENTLKIIESFIKYRVVQDNEIVFSIDSFEMQGLLFLPLLLERSLLKKITQDDKNKLQKLLIQSYNEFYETDLCISEQVTMDELFHLTQKMSLDDKSKWIYLSVLYEPIPYYERLAHTLKSNIHALHKAFQDHAAYIEQSLQEFYKSVPAIYTKENDDIVIPLISNPVSYLELGRYAYCGIKLHNILGFNNKEQMIENDELAYILKVLADKTRLEILKSLKEGPSYNLEIAQKLGLTPATVSHHMTALLMRKFVSLEKHGGYTYYELNREVLSSLIQHLRINLL